MPLRVIEVDPADTYYSLRHRLLWHGRGRVVLLWPSHTAHASPTRGIDLVLLRRLADRERLDIGLVTSNRDVARHARALGLPAFPNLALARHFRPGWWRGGRRGQQLGFAPGQSHRPPAETIRPSAPAGIHVLSSLVYLLTAVLLLGILGLAAALTIPTATVRIRPQPVPVQIIAGFTADPSVPAVADGVIPAREVTFDQPWEATGDAAEDRNRIAGAARDGITAAAPELFAAQLEPDERLVPSSISVEIIGQRFETSGDTAVLAATYRLAGLAVREDDLRPALLRQLGEALAAGYAPDPASLQIDLEPGPDAPAGAFQVTATATGRASIDPAALAGLLRGQRAADAARYLSETYQLAEPPEFDVRPSWWWGASRGRFPYRAERIAIEMLP